MGDEAPAVFSLLVPSTRLVEVHVKALDEIRDARRGCDIVSRGRGGKTNGGEFAIENARHLFYFSLT